MTTNILLFWMSFVIISAVCTAVLIAIILVLDYIAHPDTSVTITFAHNDGEDIDGH